MTRYTHDHEPHEYEAAGHTEPEYQPYDAKYEWLIWIFAALCGLVLSYGVIKLIPILGGVLSWK